MRITSHRRDDFPEVGSAGATREPIYLALTGQFHKDLTPPTPNYHFLETVFGLTDSFLCLPTLLTRSERAGAKHFIMCVF